VRFFTLQVAQLKYIMMKTKDYMLDLEPEKSLCWNKYKKKIEIEDDRKLAILENMINEEGNI
jgi:hypothetical protein